MIDTETLVLLQKSAPLLLRGALMTIRLAVLAVIIGAVFGTIMGVLNSKRLRMRGLGRLIDLYVTVVRGTPIFIQILIVYFALPDLLGMNLSPFFAGELALGMNSVAYVSEIVRGGINAVPVGQWEAAYVLGYRPFGALRFVILPQMFRNVLPALTNELIVLIKETSLLSSIGLMELTRVSRDIIARELEPMVIYLAAALLYLFMTTTISLLAQRLERRLAHD